MATLAIIGAGGHGKVVADCALASGNWSDVVFYDDRYPEIKKVASYNVVGSVKTLCEHEYLGDVAIGIGNNYTRDSIQKRLAETGISLVSVFHPSAVVSSMATLGEGCVVMPNAVINCDARIGACSIVNSGAVVEHDCRLGDCVHISPGASLAGGVNVGERSWIGIGSCVIESLTIGADSIVAAGSVVTRNVDNNTRVCGVPAKTMD